MDAYPNPFNPAVTITVRAAATGPATLAVYDARGARVATLFDGVLPAGSERSLLWNGGTTAGAGLSSGVYFARLRTQRGTSTQKLVMLK